MFKSPGEVAFSIFSVDIYFYGIIMAFAILAGLFVVIKIAKKYFPEFSTDKILDISFLFIFWGIIGARLYYVLLDCKYFIKYPLEILAMRNGGISIQGAIIAGIIVGIYYLKKYKINFFRLADLFVFGLVTGQIIGRWGNFFNSEAFGTPTNLFWKLYIPYNNRPLEYKNYEFFHPAFLYESLLSLCIFFILFFILSKYKNRKDGLIFYLYIILYSLARILVEFLRTDSVLNIYGIHIAHITSFIFIVFAIIGLYILYSKKTKV